MPPIRTGGTTGCTGEIHVKVWVPATAALCGYPFSTQWGVLCNGISGSAVSNCLSWTISNG